ncbi:HAD family hydrolase [uncultured Croceitalea sp.]|uniref:HAD family hydrolase n=1 Tax=uncultured Croceitalea sp. TaxID=1798908 RepID=UPI003305FD45
MIFDCDGVLVDSLPLANRVMLELIAPFGVSKEFEKVIHHYNGGSLWASLAKIEELMGEKLPEDFVGRYRESTYKTFKEELQPIEGAKGFLERNNLPKCVASSGPYEKIEQNLHTTNLLHHFGNNIFSSYEIKSWKPEPDIFLHAAAKMGFKPKECVVIEDSLDGIAAAVKGGFDCIGLTTETNLTEMKKSPAMVFKSMSEIEKFLQ